MTAPAVPAATDTPVRGAAERLPRGRRKSRGKRFALHLTLIVIMALWLVPAVGLLINSFRPSELVSSSGWWTALAPPYEFTFSNYTEVLTRQGIDRAFVNSLFITVPATIIVLAVAAFAAYAFAWMDFIGKNVIFVIVVGLLVVPLQVTLVPLLTLFRETGIAGTFLAVWLAHTGFGLPFAVYLLRNYMGGLPREVFEAASIDGASHTTSFFRLALPMSAPVQVSNLVNSLGGQWHLLTAAAFLMMILPLVVFVTLQRYFVRGITGGAVKG